MIKLFAPMLLILFIGLKLGEVGTVADWSWWWVMSPVWVPPLLIVIVVALVATFRGKP